MALRARIEHELAAHYAARIGVEPQIAVHILRSRLSQRGHRFGAFSGRYGLGQLLGAIDLQSTHYADTPQHVCHQPFS